LDEVRVSMMRVGGIAVRQLQNKKEEFTIAAVLKDLCRREDRERTNVQRRKAK
jgi:hypothetical protein